MKSFLVAGCIFLVAGVARADIKAEISEGIKEHVGPCSEEINVSAEEIMSKFYDSKLEGEDKTKVGCMKACIMKHMDMFEDGHVNADRIAEWMTKILEKTPEKIPQKVDVVRSCAEENKAISDECEHAFEFSRCVMDKDTD